VFKGYWYTNVYLNVAYFDSFEVSGEVQLKYSFVVQYDTAIIINPLEDQGRKCCYILYYPNFLSNPYTRRMEPPVFPRNTV